jgi:hypothetical protein
MQKLRSRSYYASITNSIILALIVICAGAGVASGDGGAMSPSSVVGFSQTEDGDPSDPSTIRNNYFKRFPYAKSAADSDVVQDGESTAGTTESYEAYTQVQKNCDGDGIETFCNGLNQSCKSAPPVLIPHIHYKQDSQTATVSLPSRRDSEALHYKLVKTYGLPMSDAQFQIIDRNNKQRLLELMFDPERWMWAELASAQLQSSNIANGLGGSAQSTFEQAYDSMNTVLLNVANEKAVEGSSGGGVQAAVRLVQQAYQQIFMPIALLLLLPGVLLTQLKGMMGVAFFGRDDDGQSPFDGIIRAVIALFLIPATQLIVSYAIDVGNQLTEAVRAPEKGYIQKDVLVNWMKQQTYVPQLGFNALLVQGAGGAYGGGTGGAGSGAAAVPSAGGSPTSGSGPATQFNLNIFGSSQFGQAGNAAINNFLAGFFGQGVDFAARAVGLGGGEGKESGQAEEQSHLEDQLFLSTGMEMGFNGSACLMGFSLTVLTAFQLVFMCYLFLLGPIAAAFFAWPSGFGKLFKTVFTNWVDAVIVLSLWRFYWCIILACMTQRLIYLQQNGGFNANSPLEMVVFNCFLALLLYVPFQPFTFNPGEAASAVLDKAQQGGGGGGGAPGAVPGATQGIHHADQPGGGEHDAPASHGHQRQGFATTEFASISTGQSPTTAWPGERSAAGDDAHHSSPSSSEGSASNRLQEMADPPAVDGVAGERTSARQTWEPPPLSGKRAAVTAEMRNSLAGLQIDSIPAGQAPTVALSPSEGTGPSGRFLINTANSEQARAGIEAWQQLGGSGDVPAGQVQPAGAVPPSAESPAQQVTSVESKTSSATAITPPIASKPAGAGVPSAGSNEDTPPEKQGGQTNQANQPGPPGIDDLPPQAPPPPSAGQ